MSDTIAEGVRPPGVAGFFYPSSPKHLSGVVDHYLSSAGGPADSARPLALVAPHAGYDYSGMIAGHAFAAISGFDYDAVILLGPSHLESFPGVSLFPGVAYRTPLGTCHLSTDLAGTLVDAAADVIHSSLNGHWIEHERRQEHALEVELPFLQQLQDQMPEIVPLVMGEQSWDTAEALGLALAKALASQPDPGRVLLVASSDLSHFHGDSHAEHIDHNTLDAVEGFDPVAFHEALRSGKAEACGGGAIAAIMLASRELGATGATTIAYAHSGHVSGDRESVVGYGAVRID
jgi:AmmeMemoRadiSam system protein B